MNESRLHNGGSFFYVLKFSDQSHRKMAFKTNYSCDGMGEQKLSQWTKKRWFTGVTLSQMQHDRTSVSPDYPLSLVREGGEMPKHCIEEKVYSLEDVSGDSAALKLS